MNMIVISMIKTAIKANDETVMKNLLSERRLVYIHEI